MLWQQCGVLPKSVQFTAKDGVTADDRVSPRCGETAIVAHQTLLGVGRHHLRLAGTSALALPLSPAL